jgi:hypothetical protein
LVPVGSLFVALVCGLVRFLLPISSRQIDESISIADFFRQIEESISIADFFPPN